HEAGPRVRYAGEGSVPLRRLLGRFVSVCQTVAYAHSRGVLHRDLKPANVLLGEYGETLVIDWGLAKPMDRPEAPGGAEGGGAPRPPAGGGPGGTQAGEVLGTPAYMSPEQAAGRVELLGPATDVYSLGAVLYAVLTGRAPFTGEDRAEVLGAVREGRWEPPRSVRPEVPA